MLPSTSVTVDGRTPTPLTPLPTHPAIVTAVHHHSSRGRRHREPVVFSAHAAEPSTLLSSVTAITWTSCALVSQSAPCTLSPRPTRSKRLPQTRLITPNLARLCHLPETSSLDHARQYIIPRFLGKHSSFGLQRLFNPRHRPPSPYSASPPTGVAPACATDRLGLFQAACLYKRGINLS